MLFGFVVPTQTALAARPPILNNVGLDQKLDVRLPPQLIFRDEEGRQVRLGEFFGKRPLILALVYYKCPGLCTMVLNDLTKSMNSMRATCGQQFDILTISFDPNETPELAVEKKQQYLRAYRRPPAEQGWHFLTGPKESIDALTHAVGFRYVWDPQAKQYAHASGLIVLTPQGKTSHYFYGIDYAPTELESSLDRAAAEQTVPIAATEQILLYCFHYDPSTGRYSLIVFRAIQVGGVLTCLLLGSYMVWASAWRKPPMKGGNPK
jgi:protein SCO1/2